MMQQLKSNTSDRMSELASMTTLVRNIVDGSLEAWRKSTIRAEKDFVKGQWVSNKSFLIVGVSV